MSFETSALPLQPVPQERPWGGARAASVADLPDPDPSAPVGEWWLLSCREQAPTPVAQGPYEGASLPALLKESAEQILGAAMVERYQGEFPLLLKILDSAIPLSVQVHPSNRLRPGQGKTESWYCLDCEEGASIYLGLKSGITLKQFLDTVDRGESPISYMADVPARSGLTVHVPAGTVHALGGGMVVLEVQQSSDTTYRLYDWGRKPERDLHIAEARMAASKNQSPQLPDPQPLANQPFPRETLVTCDAYRMDRLYFDGEVDGTSSPDRFEVLVPLSDGVQVCTDSVQLPAPAGRAVLIPAALRDYRLTSEAEARVLQIRPS
jgi:mannose-6-phosphate isomerase